jgi:signal peptidase I
MEQSCGTARTQSKRHFGRWVLAVALGGAIGISAGHTVVASFSGSVAVVDGTSMAPTYSPGMRVYTAPIHTELQRGDVVAVDDGNEDYALKRIVGLPGETVHLWRGYVFINRQMLREPYLPRHTYTFPDQRTEWSAFVLGSSQYFILGDNREHSVDSRLYGPVTRKQIKSRVPADGGGVPTRFAAYTLPAEGKRTIRPL